MQGLGGELHAKVESKFANFSNTERLKSNNNKIELIIKTLKLKGNEIEFIASFWD